MNKNNLTEILIQKSNDKFRKSQDPNDASYIYDAPINTARKIILNIASNHTRSNHINLIAQPQVGKTSVMCATINIINQAKLYKNMAINKFFVISGMNDVGLRDQTKERILNQCIGVTDENLYSSKNKNTKCKFFVLKNSELMSYDGIIDNSIIFIDESHYGSREHNKLTKFFTKHGIDWKNTNELIKRNIYIVSVSATPFCELISDTVEVKKMVELTASSDYVGISHFLERGLIFDANKDDICEDGIIFDNIMDAYERMLHNNEIGVVMIRTRHFNIIKDNSFVQENFDIHEMYANGSKLEYDIFNEQLENIYRLNQEKKSHNNKPLLVLIKGAFRAGISIPTKCKDYIYMVYDYSVKADTTCQALLGRMCGHRNSMAKIDNTYFFINKKFADQYSSWEKEFMNKTLIPCENTKFEWVDSEYEGDDVDFGTKSCGNFAIDLSNDELMKIYSTCHGKRNVLGIMESLFPTILQNHNYNIHYDYMEEAHMKGKNHYAKTSQTKRFDSFSDSSLVFLFRPNQIKKFMDDTKRDYFNHEDLGKRCVSLVLDATIDIVNNKVIFGGNKRLLVYYVEVGLKHKVFSRAKQYQAHKDTNLNNN